MLQQHKNIFEREMFCHNFAKIKLSVKMNYNLGVQVVLRLTFTFNKYVKSIIVNGTKTSLNLINFKCFSKKSPLKGKITLILRQW